MQQLKQYKLYLFFLVVSVVALWCFQAKLNPLYFPIDDAYITLHNAQVLHLGYDQNYPNTPALFGSTSLVHLALVSLALFWVPPLTALFLVQGVGVVLYVFGLLRLASIFNASLIQTITFVIIGTTLGYSLNHLLTGMDTLLAMAAVLWALILAETYRSNVSKICLPILCGTLPFVRPELALLALLLSAYQVWFIYQQKLADSKKSIIIAGILTIIAATPWLIWSWLDTGSFYPETMIAKANFFAELYFLIKYKLFITAVWLSKFIMSGGYFGFLGMAVLLCRTPLGRVGLVFIIVLFAAYALTYPTAFYDNKQRYIYIVVPILLYGLIAAIQSPEKITRRCANGLMTFALVFSAWQLPMHWHKFLEDRELMRNESETVAQWCNHYLPPGSKLLIHDAGYMAYATSFHLIDLVGLKTPSSIAFHHRITLPSQGIRRAEAIADIMRYNHPDYIVLGATFLENLPAELTNQGWKLKAVRSSKDGFTVYQIIWP